MIIFSGVNNEWQENESEINVRLGKLQLFIHVSKQNYVWVRGDYERWGGGGRKKTGPRTTQRGMGGVTAGARATRIEVIEGRAGTPGSEHEQYKNILEPVSCQMLLWFMW